MDDRDGWGECQGDPCWQRDMMMMMIFICLDYVIKQIFTSQIISKFLKHFVLSVFKKRRFPGKKRNILCVLFFGLLPLSLLFLFATQHFNLCILRPSSCVSCLSEYRNNLTWELIFKVWLLIEQGFISKITILGAQGSKFWEGRRGAVITKEP